MRKFRVTFFFLTVALALSGCGILGGSDGTDVTVAEDVAAQPTVNNVQSVPAQGSGSTTDGGEAGSADGALPTAVTLPTAAPTPEPTVDRSQPTTYIVQSGDVLGLIAERFDADIAELRRVNGLDGNLIRVGQELTIPALDAATAATSVPSSTTAPSGPVTCSSAATGHCVQPGESLLGIALKYDVTVEALRAANPGVSGDLIKSGEVLNLPSGSTSPTPAATSAPSSPDGTPVPTVTVGPLNDADCKAANPQFPYFHAADGLCYANPIGATAVPTAVGNGANDTCQPGFFLWEDGLCYPIPGVTVTPTAGPSPESTQVYPYYGSPPCRTGYVVLTTGLCWPDTETTPEVLPTP
ncbi:MAG: LysM peptidoglycan-binding domain-containing protein [Acidimicrobiaceae bacterium]|nr:LysM peptidoglycan-binding domain-containing protein [Acidimicrobiaceae bacterium]